MMKQNTEQIVVIPEEMFTAGGPNDPRKGQAMCEKCGIIAHPLSLPNEGPVWIDDKGERHTGHTLKLLPEARPPKVKLRLTSEHPVLVDEYGLGLMCTC